MTWVMRRGSFVGDGVSGLWSASGNGLMGAFRFFGLMVRNGGRVIEWGEWDCIVQDQGDGWEQRAIRDLSSHG